MIVVVVVRALDFKVGALEFGVGALDFGARALDFRVGALDFGVGPLDFRVGALDRGKQDENLHAQIKRSRNQRRFANHTQV